MRVALIAPKNTQQERSWLGSFFPFPVEEYRRGRIYDAVIFWNFTREVEHIRASANTLICGFGVEPALSENYDASLLQYCDFYCAYENFADRRFTGVFHPFVYFADPAEKIRTTFRSAVASERDVTSVLFARHDPNVRLKIATIIREQGGLAIGPLFGCESPDKIPLQRRCRYEWITENRITDWYLSEKLPQSLMAACVPVYYGCRRVREKVDPGLFVDLSEFGDPEKIETIRRAAYFCNRPDVYETYRQRIQTVGEEYLVENFSLEKTVADPLSAFITTRIKNGFHVRKKNFYSRMGSVVNRLFPFGKRAGI